MVANTALKLVCIVYCDSYVFLDFGCCSWFCLWLVFLILYIYLRFVLFIFLGFLQILSQVKSFWQIFNHCMLMKPYAQVWGWKIYREDVKELAKSECWHCSKSPQLEGRALGGAISVVLPGFLGPVLWRFWQGPGTEKIHLEIGT